MPRTLIATLALVALVFAACSGGDKKDDAGGDSSGDETPRATRTKAPSSSGDDADLSKHEDELRETVPAAYKAIFAGGGVDAYKYASDDFRSKCKLDDFIGVIAFIKIFLGDLKEEDIAVEITDIRYEEGKAFVDVTGTIQGEELSTSDDGDSFSDYWVYEDGAWKWGTDDAEPCDTSTGFDSSTSDDATPPTGPGSSRTQPAPFGKGIETGDGRRVTILSTNFDAEEAIASLDDFPSTPEPGRRIILVRVKVEHAGAASDETIQVFEGDYKITGSNNVLYSSFDDGVSCGFLDDSLQGEIFPGGTIEGYVCFQVPTEETNLLLVSEPSFSFGDTGKRRFFALE